MQTCKDFFLLLRNEILGSENRHLFRVGRGFRSSFFILDVLMIFNLLNKGL